MSDYVECSTLPYGIKLGYSKLRYHPSETLHSCAQEILLTIAKIKGCGSCHACKMAWLARLIVKQLSPHFTNNFVIASKLTHVHMSETLHFDSTVELTLRIT